NQVVIQDGCVDIQSKMLAMLGMCYNCNGKSNYARECPKPRVHDAKYFKEQMLLTTKDEAGVHLNEKENDFMLNNTYGDKMLEELNVEMIMMAEHDTNAHNQSIHDFETLINNVQEEAEKQRKVNVELKKQKVLLQRELETCKKRVKEFENKPEQDLDYKEAYEEFQNEMNVEKEQLLNEKEEIREEFLKNAR
nr:hypothetical protein [Tanacetum cinerariifolium]